VSSLFSVDQPPEGFFAITLHTLELAAPAATTWGLPVLLYPVLPDDSDDYNHNHSHKEKKETNLDRQTQAAAQELVQPRWAGKTVVMVWEHKHIAKQKLERDPSHPVTLRQLLGLDRLVGVPSEWPGNIYDYFWIVDYAGGVPSAFHMQKQIFPAPYQDIPANEWTDPKPSRTPNCK
jgi:hypothetical protein